MGFDYHARAVIGVAVPREKLLEATRERGCGHPEVPGKFCPECGGPTWVSVKRRIAAWVQDSRGDWRLAGFDTAEGLYDGRVFVGVMTRRAAEGRDAAVLMQMAGDIRTVRDLLARALGPLGLWDESQFGLWAILGGG